MKRVDLIRHLEQHGCRLQREGGSHSVYVNANNKKVSTVPRHREISDLLAGLSVRFVILLLDEIHRFALAGPECDVHGVWGQLLDGVSVVWQKLEVDSFGQTASSNFWPATLRREVPAGVDSVLV